MFGRQTIWVTDIWATWVEHLGNICWTFGRHTVCRYKSSWPWWCMAVEWKQSNQVALCREQRFSAVLIWCFMSVITSCSHESQVLWLVDAGW